MVRTVAWGITDLGSTFSNGFFSFFGQKVVGTNLIIRMSKIVRCSKISKLTGVITCLNKRWEIGCIGQLLSISFNRALWVIHKLRLNVKF